MFHVVRKAIFAFMLVSYGFEKLVYTVMRVYRILFVIYFSVCFLFCMFLHSSHTTWLWFGRQNIYFLNIKQWKHFAQICACTICILNKLIDPDNKNNNNKRSIMSITHVSSSGPWKKFPQTFKDINLLWIYFSVTKVKFHLMILVLSSLQNFIIGNCICFTTKTKYLFKRNSYEKNVQSWKYDCCVSFGKQNIPPIITTAVCIYSLCEPTYFPVIWLSYLKREMYFNVKK